MNVNDLPWMDGFLGKYTFTEVFVDGRFVGYLARKRDTREEEGKGRKKNGRRA